MIRARTLRLAAVAAVTTLAVALPGSALGSDGRDAGARPVHATSSDAGPIGDVGEDWDDPGAATQTDAEPAPAETLADGRPPGARPGPAAEMTNGPADPPGVDDRDDPSVSPVTPASASTTESLDDGRDPGARPGPIPEPSSASAPPPTGSDRDG